MCALAGGCQSLACCPPTASSPIPLLLPPRAPPLQRADGTINPLHFTLLWPYHVGLRAKLALQRRLSSEPSFDRVGEHYYIGAWPSEQRLVPTVHPAVLDVTCELPLQVVPPAYLNLAVWDTHAPTPPQIEQGVQWALQQRAAGRPVLVHCAHGHGRSATVLAAILIGGLGAARCGAGVGCVPVLWSFVEGCAALCLAAGCLAMACPLRLLPYYQSTSLCACLPHYLPACLQRRARPSRRQRRWH